MPTTNISLGILDRANHREGTTAAQVLQGVVTRAQHLETLGYDRIWVAEHHGVPGIAGSAPTLLMGAVAGATRRIRVGSGGIMLPDHQPLVAAEQIATLEALYPSRIDIGLGRSIGFTPAVRRALRQDSDAGERFEQDLVELQHFLAGTAPITMQPQNDSATPLYLLAHGESIDIAARLGLGVVVGGPALRGQAKVVRHAGLERYRRNFTPSTWFKEPTVIVSARVAVADSRAEATRLILPEAWALALSRTTGAFDPLKPAEDLDLDSLTQTQRDRVEKNLGNAIVGDPDEVRERILALLEFTGTNSLLVTGNMHDPADQARSDELLAELANR